jgi:hypothetical protein
LTEKYDINEKNPDLSTKEKIHAYRRYMRAKYLGIEEIEVKIGYIHYKKKNVIIRWETAESLYWDQKYQDQEFVKKKEYGGFEF